MAVVVFVLVCLVLCILAMKSSNEDAEQRTNKLARIAERFTDGASQDPTATGTCNGIAVTYSFATRGSGSNSETWTEITAAIPDKYPLAIHVRRHGRGDWARIERGEMVDVLLGAPEFDAAFLVEVAPADVASLLLDQPARALLEQYDPVELTTETVGERKVLQFAFRTWCEAPDLALALTESLVRIASRVRDAYALAEQASAIDDVAGDPYRAEPDDSATREAADQRTVEVDRLESLRANRASDASAALFIVIVMCFALFLIAIAAQQR